MNPNTGSHQRNLAFSEIVSHSINLALLKRLLCIYVYLIMTYILLSFFREAERNPGPNEFQSFVTPFEKIINKLILKKSTGISPKVDVKFPWKNPFSMKDSDLVVPTGDKTMYEIGRRYARKFPELLKERFSIGDYEFTSVPLRSASQTAMAFAMGYLKGKGVVTSLKMQPVPFTTLSPKNKILPLFWQTYPKWIKHVFQNPSSYTEFKKFGMTKVNIVKERIKRLLGLEASNKITIDSVRAISTLCAIERAKFGISGQSSWCSLIAGTEDIGNYYNDLNDWYLYGPGNELNANLSCDLLKGIFQSIQARSKKNKKSQNKVIVRVGYFVQLLTFLDRLGLFINEPMLKADDFLKVSDRKYKVGKLAPFSGNIAFVLYECNTDYKTDYKLQFYLNERLTKLPSCVSMVDCSLADFKEYYKGIVDKCNHKKTCKVD